MKQVDEMEAIYKVGKFFFWVMTIGGAAILIVEGFQYFAAFVGLLFQSIFDILNGITNTGWIIILLIIIISQLSTIAGAKSK